MKTFVVRIDAKDYAEIEDTLDKAGYDFDLLEEHDN